jgi:hypothetical protein
VGAVCPRIRPDPDRPLPIRLRGRSRGAPPPRARAGAGTPDRAGGGGRPPDGVPCAGPTAPRAAGDGEPGRRSILYRIRSRLGRERTASRAPATCRSCGKAIRPGTAYCLSCAAIHADRDARIFDRWLVASAWIALVLLMALVIIAV